MPLHHVSDASELEKLIRDGVIDADRVVAVVGKTEGNGGVNDYTRIIADRAYREMLAAHGARDVHEIPIVWSGGTDGVLSPHATIFATVPADAAPRTDEPRVTVGFAMSEQLLPEDIGRSAMVTKVAAAVGRAMQRAGIDDPADMFVSVSAAHQGPTAAVLWRPSSTSAERGPPGHAAGPHALLRVAQTRDLLRCRRRL